MLHADEMAGSDMALGRHALRTPLLAIMGGAELLVAGDVGPLTRPAAALVREMVAAARSLERIGELLFRFAELPAGMPRGERTALVELAQQAGLTLKADGIFVETGGDYAAEALRLAIDLLHRPEVQLWWQPCGTEVLLHLTCASSSQVDCSGAQDIGIRLLHRLVALGLGRLVCVESQLITLAWRRLYPAASG